jgi:uncharacterized protein
VSLIGCAVLCLLSRIFVITIIQVTNLTWDEKKRLSNLQKHGLDFADAAEVLNSRYRLDIAVVRQGEHRTHSLSYVMDRLAVLSLVHLERDANLRILSFRYASESEAEFYYEWLEEEDD